LFWFRKRPKHLAFSFVWQRKMMKRKIGLIEMYAQKNGWLF